MAKKTIEIDEDEYAAEKGLVGVVQRIAGNAGARKLLQQARKLVDPDVVIPELEADTAAHTATNQVLDELKKFREEQAERDRLAKEEAANAKFTNSWNAQKSGLRAEGYFDETIGEIEKLAQERGIPDLEAAALLYRKLNPPSDVATPFSGQSWDFFQPQAEEKGYMEAMMNSKGEDEGALRGEINAALSVERRPRRAA